MIAAIDWVVQHKNANGLNIRVLNLSFGTDGVQSYQLDPLAYAVEQAWHKGIVVVVAAGNAGYGTREAQQPGLRPVRDRRRRFGRHGARRPRTTTSSRPGRRAATARATPTSSRRASPWSACGCPARSWTRPTRVRGPVSGSSAAPAPRSRRRSSRALRRCSSSSGRSSPRTRSRRCSWAPPVSCRPPTPSPRVRVSIDVRRGERRCHADRCADLRALDGYRFARQGPWYGDRQARTARSCAVRSTSPGAQWNASGVRARRSQGRRTGRVRSSGAAPGTGCPGTG